MDRRVWKAISLFAGLILLCLVLAQTSVVAQSQGASRVQSSATNSDAYTASLQQQNQLIKDYDQKILNVVLWSLGGVFLVTILLAGFNWFTNTRVYEKEREALILLLQSKINEQKSLLQENFASLANDLERKVADGVKGLSANYNSLLAQVAEQRDALRAETANLKTSLSTEIQGKMEQLEKRLNVKVDRNEYEFLKFTAEQLEKNQHGSSPALRIWIDCLEVTVRMGGYFLDYWGEYPLEGIKRCLQGERVTVTYEMAENVKKLSRAVPPKYEPLTVEVMALLDKALTAR